jgi:dihydrofolate reductase
VTLSWRGWWGEALDQAQKAAGDRDVAIAGGAATANQYRAASLTTHISYRLPH